MITVISGTNRPSSNTAKVAALAVDSLRQSECDVRLLDLTELPPEIFNGASYADKPEGFEPFQQAILDAEGILTVIPEYNGAFPGVMKYFIDMLRFPDSLYEKPAGFIGLSAGPWGAVRAVEQLEMVFQYRHAHLFGRRVFIPNVGVHLDEDGRITDPALITRLNQAVKGFAEFCDRLTG
ncbi:MAG: NAD(P)H-dependent oxidoreductase [Thermoanaerobaculales bacterium]|jgi:NAD(P)H-dependent FMN reductase|nr:NAD(P)H-dependent oxidoreductase [Thermoanaerobaculales bacterium]